MAVSNSDYTKVVHAGVKPDKETGAIMTPIYQTSTYVQSEPGVHQGWDYSRAGNPTRDALESSFAALEGAKLAWPSLLVWPLSRPSFRPLIPVRKSLFAMTSTVVQVACLGRFTPNMTLTLSSWT